MYDYRDAEKDPTIAGRHLNWIRAFYEDVYRTTGGVPTVAASTSAHTDGCYVNYPDTDLDDTVRNTSGQPAHRLYYKENYTRLQRAKQRWDPHNVFRHAQSIRLPGKNPSGSGAAASKTGE
ncbi:BBE domain-containing protein [Streptomyces kanamyceticus]|uniref:BBE domain-containing protein n=1 Tax=Streptomyces kanamyceticus TaxID=1967 RepID=UPI0037DD9CD4